jgi:hypothetical protein
VQQSEVTKEQAHNRDPAASHEHSTAKGEFSQLLADGRNSDTPEIPFLPPFFNYSVFSCSEECSCKTVGQCMDLFGAAYLCAVFIL